MNHGYGYWPPPPPPPPPEAREERPPLPPRPQASRDAYASTPHHQTLSPGDYRPQYYRDSPGSSPPQPGTFPRITRKPVPAPGNTPLSPPPLPPRPGPPRSSHSSEQLPVSPEFNATQHWQQQETSTPAYWSHLAQPAQLDQASKSRDESYGPVSNALPSIHDDGNAAASHGLHSTGAPSFLVEQPWWQEHKRKEEQEREANIAAGYGHLYDPPPVPPASSRPPIQQQYQPPVQGQYPDYEIPSQYNNYHLAGDQANSSAVTSVYHGAVVDPLVPTGPSAEPTAHFDVAAQQTASDDTGSQEQMPVNRHHIASSVEEPYIADTGITHYSRQYFPAGDMRASSTGTEEPSSWQIASTTAHESQPTESKGLMGAITDLVNDFSTLSTQEPEASTTLSSHGKAIEDSAYDDGEWTRPAPIQDDRQEPNEIRWDCPGEREFDYETTWYHLADVPDFLICTRCHEMYVSGTSMSEFVQKTRKTGGKCRFNVSRLTAKLMGRFREDGDIRPIKEYMVARLQIPDCKGLERIKTRQGAKFSPKEEQPGVMAHFTICEACYEDQVLPSAYGDLFGPRENFENLPETISCDMCFDYIKRSLREFSRKGRPFSEWVAAATKRFGLPQCEGKTVESSSREWVRPCGTDMDFSICETCYFEKISLTALDSGFEYIPIQKPVTGSEWMDQALGHRSEPATAWVCDAITVGIKEALYAAAKRKDVTIFNKAAAASTTSPRCTNSGITEGTWYTLAEGCDGYNVCNACYASCVEVWDLGRFYKKSDTSGSAEPVVCNFNQDSPRFTQSMLRLSEAMHTGVWSIFSDFTRKYTGVAVCPRTDNVKDLRWYGFADCLVCAECYMAFCQDNSPKPGLDLEFNNDIIADARMCCLYSPRMRAKWTEACKKGSPDELIEFSLKRHAVYVRTIPQIRMLRQMQEMQMMQALNAGQMGLMYQGVQSIQTISGSTDGYLHGNSSLGWHETEAGVTSAQYFSQMNSNFSQANSSGSWGTIIQLAAQWDEVE